MACGIISLGLLKYFELLFERLGIEMSPDIYHFLSVRDGGRARRLQKVKTTEFKRKQKANFYSKLKDEMIVVQKERDVRECPMLAVSVPENENRENYEVILQ